MHYGSYEHNYELLFMMTDEWWKYFFQYMQHQPLDEISAMSLPCIHPLAFE